MDRRVSRYVSRRRTLPSRLGLIAIAMVLSGICTISRAGVQPIAPGSWTLAILPDTQYYTTSPDYVPRFTSQTTFLRDNAANLNLQYVLHEGDVTQDNVPVQWGRAKSAMDVLNGVVPYAMVSGNHDVGPNGSAANRDSFFNDPAYFGPGSYYATQPSIGGFYKQNKTDSSWHTFNVNGQDWLIVNLEWAPTNEALDWASQVLDDHPNSRSIILTHSYMFSDNTRYNWAARGTSQYANPHQFPPYWLTGPESVVNDGEEIWNKLVRTHDNVDFVFSGHVLTPGTGYRSDLSNGGHVVHQMLANSQDDPSGIGNLRLLEFKTDGSVEVRTYSPFFDQYNRQYTQQYTVHLDELSGPPTPPPPPMRAVAANLVMWGPTNPAANTIDAITIPQTSVPAFGVPMGNRGDFELSVGGSRIKYTEGILLATITQHDRPDFAGRHSTVEVGRNSFGDGFLALSTTEAGVSCCNETNFNTSVAWFRFGAGFHGAHVNNDGSLAAASGVTAANVTRKTFGRYNVDLGVNSLTDGMLFTIGDNNSNVVVQTGPMADGSGWDVRVAQSAHDFGTAVGSTPAGPANWSFLYLPFSTPGLTGGHFDGVNDTSTASVGNFALNRLSSGQYELALPGESPETGMLILTVANLKTDGLITAPDDNFLTYEAGANGSFLINSYDLPSSVLEDTSFAWAFVSFDNGFSALDLGSSTGATGYALWKSQFGKSEPGLTADLNEDGMVDASDYVLWRRSTTPVGVGSGSGSQVGQPIPEPSSFALAALAGCSLCGRRLRVAVKSGQ